MTSKQDKIRDLIINGNMYKAIFIIRLPLIISNIIQSLYDLIDMFYIAKLGAGPLI